MKVLNVRLIFRLVFHLTFSVTLPLGLLSAAVAAAKVTPSLKLIRNKDIVSAIQHVNRGKLVVHGKEWDARKYCNEATIKTRRT
ncbi:MAG: hypothetical protein HC883_05485 [Bdellovibrionaceae bacterium]|nr:hypothetical protein [Pseudobdellovibrionaceae bacterium]